MARSFCLVMLLLIPCIVPNQSYGQSTATTSDEQEKSTRLDKVPDGIFLVNRWTIDRDDLFPLFEDEILIQHDPKDLELDSQEPVMHVTVELSKCVLFDKLKHLEPKEQADGRINLNMTLASKSVTDLEKLTRRHLGRQVAVVIDGKAVTMHKIRSIIKDGQVQIMRCTDEGCKVILQRLVPKK